MYEIYKFGGAVGRRWQFGVDYIRATMSTSFKFILHEMRFDYITSRQRRALAPVC